MGEGMSLIEQTLWGERDKVQIAIDRLKEFEPTEGYYLAFSGGKDSITVYRLAQMAGVKFQAVYNITTVDPPELVQFIKREYPEVERHHPTESMWALIALHQGPPLRHQRYCCAELKERGGTGRVVLTGVRWAESPRRNKRRMTEQCMTDGSKTFLHPIIDWTTDEVWEFIRQERLPYCSLYDEGFSRVGCVLCPMSRNTERDIARWPKIAAQYVRTLDRIVIQRQETGEPCTYANGQEWFDWWIQRDAKGQDDAQLVLFE